MDDLMKQLLNNGKTLYVYREHENEYGAKTVDKMVQRAGDVIKGSDSPEGFYADKDAGYLYLRANKFSTYAVVYENPTPDTPQTPDTPGTPDTPDTPERPADGGGGGSVKPEKPKPEEPKPDVPEEPEDGGNTNITVDRTFHKLPLTEAKATKTAVKVSWKQVADADGYVIYCAQCNTNNKTYKFKKIAVIKNGSKITYTNKKLKSGTYYKYYIKAYKLVNGKKVWLAKSKAIHATTSGGKYGNAKAVKVNKSSVALKKGKTFKLQAVQVTNGKPIQKHAKIKYESTNKKVATVNSKGVIKAKKKGTCYIYVYAQNGVYKRIKVTVK